MVSVNALKWKHSWHLFPVGFCRKYAELCAFAKFFLAKLIAINQIAVNGGKMAFTLVIDRHSNPPGITMKNITLRPLALLVACLAGTAAAGAQESLSVPDMSLEDLVNTEVVSASRKAQSLQHVAAAVFVISQDDIARSGARNLADVLAMAPGIEVAQLGNNRWAVSARGSNSRFARSLQVLKDGRSVYSPLFSGVFWEAEDMVLEDIERIEIIRGPNAAMWGANAVNGTINIITKKARDTQGGLVAVRAGSEDKGNITARYGFALGDSGHMRIYGKGGATRAGYAADGSRAEDKGNSGLAGFRADWLLSSGNRLSLNGETYRYNNRDVYAFPDPLVPGYINAQSSNMELNGGHLQGRFESLYDDGSELTVQSYFAQRTMNASGLANEERSTIDVDVQYRLAPRGNHDLMIGANYRNSHDAIKSAAKYVTFTNDSNHFQLAGLFFNDDITVVPDRLKVTVGARLEYNNYSGTALQPTVRFLWTPNAEQTVWGALSRATRTPSRAERDAVIATDIVPPSLPFVPFPTLVSFIASNGADKPQAEKMDALELGYRQRFGQSLSFDASAFVHRYRDIITITSRGLDFSNLPLYVSQLVGTQNGQTTRVTGLELSLLAQITPSWRLQPSYTWQYATAEGLGDAVSAAAAERDTARLPRHMLSLRSQHNLGQAHQLDFWLKYKSRNEAMGIPDRANLDIRYAWRASRSTEVSLVGQHLLHKRSLEYLSDQLPSVPVEIGRSAYLRLDYRF